MQYKPIFSIEWNGVKPIIDSMLNYYKNNPNYSTIIVDEIIKIDGTSEKVEDTIFAHRYNDFAYIRTGNRTQVFTDKYDIYIHHEEKTIHVKEVTKNELVEIAKLIPDMSSMIKYYEVCDSAKLISTTEANYVIDFYFNHSITNRTRMLIDKNTKKIVEIYRYYTYPEDYLAQHTTFVLMKPLLNSNLDVFKEENYIVINKKKKEVVIEPSDDYKAYTFQLIKF
jgi:hypothetical protein